MRSLMSYLTIEKLGELRAIPYETYESSNTTTITNKKS